MDFKVWLYRVESRRRGETEDTLEFLKIDCCCYNEMKYLFLKCSQVRLLTIHISQVLTCRSSLTKKTE